MYKTHSTSALVPSLRVTEWLLSPRCHFGNCDFTMTSSPRQCSCKHDTALASLSFRPRHMVPRGEILYTLDFYANNYLNIMKPNMKIFDIYSQKSDIE